MSNSLHDREMEALRSLLRQPLAMQAARRNFGDVLARLEERGLVEFKTQPEYLFCITQKGLDFMYCAEHGNTVD